jgi:hypothetical protein
MSEMLQRAGARPGHAENRGMQALIRARPLAIGAAPLLVRLPAQDINQLLCRDRLRGVPQHVHQVSYVVVA